MLPHAANLNRLALLVVMAAAYAASVVLARSDLPGWSPCILRTATGWPCPSCGFTRAFIEISHGNIAAATSLNVLALPVYLLGLATAMILTYECLRSRDVLGAVLRRHSRVVYAGLIAAVALRYVALSW